MKPRHTAKTTQNPHLKASPCLCGIPALSKSTAWLLSFTLMLAASNFLISLIYKFRLFLNKTGATQNHFSHPCVLSNDYSLIPLYN